MKDIVAALGGRGQTALYQWLWDRYDELPPYRKYKVNLVKLTAALNELGIRGRDESKPLNAGIVRKTYERVRLDRAAAATAKPAVASTPRITEPAPQARARRHEPPQASAPPAQAETDLDDEAEIVEPRSRFNLKRRVDRAR